MNGLRLYLASASPRRRELLQRIGIEPVLLPASIDESPRSGESPEDVVRRLARSKGLDAAGRIAATDGALVMAADTTVVLEERCLGKPTDDAAAGAMLRALCGREHRVLTAVYVRRMDDGRELCRVDSTAVRFRAFDDATVGAYVASGEGADKAGAYGIQGLGALLVDEIRGSWSNVVGLPLERLPDWLSALDVDIWTLAAGEKNR